MSRLDGVDEISKGPPRRADLKDLAALLGLEDAKGDNRFSRLPFFHEDVTAGSESEYQTAVLGKAEDADLPSSIRSSKYFSNLTKRIQAGEIPKTQANLLNEFLEENSEGLWENSWVRFPLARLKAAAQEKLKDDLREDKRNPASPFRRDYDRFFLEKNGDRWVRLPLSYVLKLAIIDALDCPDLASEAAKARLRLADHYSNDNSSPETYSFYVVSPDRRESIGRKLAKETLYRFLFSQLALMYASRAFGLDTEGQKGLLYFAPSVPLRMRSLNDCIADSFYRELFMSPCLSGWDRGYEKFEYMQLCHQVLSRSHLNSVFRLKEAGILQGPLIRLTNISNTSLANNGTHVSLGSRRLSELAAAGSVSAAQEKALGDLVIKIFEHFLPLFPDVYSASPWRIAYRDFRPENVAGFLSHELTNTHLRMLWRRWAKKAGIDFFGKPIPAYGPDWYEKLKTGALRMKGDFLPDVRLSDYFVALMSTPESPALSGVLGNDRALKADLARQGVFDERMSVYLPLKLREHRKMGFTGFEARYYSVFESLLEDMADAVDLQHTITAYACKAALEGRISHEDIPDDPFTESERRQFFFSSALGIETVNVRGASPNRFLTEVLLFSSDAKTSRRYSDFMKIKLGDYRLALLKLLRSDSALMESLGALPLLARCEERLLSGRTTGARMTGNILGGKKTNPLDLLAEEFNQRAERYYREDLRQGNLKEALCAFREDLDYGCLSSETRNSLRHLPAEVCPAAYLADKEEKLLADGLELREIETLLELLAAYLCQERQSTETTVLKEPTANAPVS